MSMNCIELNNWRMIHPVCPILVFLLLIEQNPHNTGGKSQLLKSTGCFVHLVRLRSAQVTVDESKVFCLNLSDTELVKYRSPEPLLAFIWTCKPVF